MQSEGLQILNWSRFFSQLKFTESSAIPVDEELKIQIVVQIQGP